MICDDLRREWEVAHPVHVISRALLDHVIASQRNKESLFQELTCPAWHPDTDETQYSTQRSNRKTYSVCICERVPRYSKCLHKCWFCFSKMFSSAFFLNSPSLHLHLLLSSLPHTPLGSSAFSPFSSLPIMPNKRRSLCHPPRICLMLVGLILMIAPWSLLNKKRLEEWENSAC